jgi:hypothetical protein
MGPMWSGHQKPNVPPSCACGSPLKGCWQWPGARPVAEVIPTSVCSLLFCSLLFLPHGLAKAERQKITGMQYNPANQRETPCLSFSTLCLYLVFPFSEELSSQHLLLPQDQSLGRVLWEKNLHSIRTMAIIISKARVPVPPAWVPICFEGLGFTKFSGLERNS